MNEMCDRSRLLEVMGVNDYNATHFGFNRLHTLVQFLLRPLHLAFWRAQIIQDKAEMT